MSMSNQLQSLDDDLAVATSLFEASNLFSWNLRSGTDRSSLTKLLRIIDATKMEMKTSGGFVLSHTYIAFLELPLPPPSVPLG